ncbi:PKD domain-containing protein [Candidatus Pacearchaeota archaeon]|nr:PKD domain-containing protein [Candidatus Pacearchaeota archaeon]
MFDSKKARASVLLFSFISLFLIPLLLIPGNINLMSIEDGGSSGKGLDLPPILSFSSNTVHTTTIATLTSVATDSGDNAGIQWIRIYQDNVLLEERNCNNFPTCTFVKVIVENNAATHQYYAQTKDLGGIIKTSSTITIIFDGFNQAPIIDSWSPVGPNPIMNENSQLGFSVTAHDPNGDVLSYMWKLDGTNVSTTNSFTYNANYFSSGIHTVYVVVYDNKGGTAVRTWNVTVNNVLIPTTCTLIFNPLSPQFYGIPVTASCSCISDIGAITETTAVLERNGIDVTTTENNVATILETNTHNYYCYTAQTANFAYAEQNATYIVNRANPNAHLALNGIENDLSIVYGTQSNATGWIETTPGASGAILYRNGTNVASGSPATEITTPGVGLYNYTYYYPQSQNYSEATVTRFLTVTQQTTNLTLIILPANIIYDGVQSNVSCNASNSEVIISLWRNGTLISSGNNYIQDVLTLPIGNYTYVCNTSGSQNYSGNSVTDLLQVIPKEPGIIELYLNGIPADLNIEYIGNPVNATAISPFNNVTIYRNGTLVGTGADFVEDITNLAAGYYIYYANSSGNASHYPANITRYVLINQSIPQLIIDMLPSDNVTYGQQTTTTCNITNTNEINGLLELYRRLYNWTNSTIAVTNPDIQTLAGGAYNYICNVSASQNFTSAYLERTLTVNRANSSIILLLDGNNSNITRIEGNTINHTGIVTLYSLPNVVDVTINIFNPVGTQIASSTGVSPHTYMYTYNVPGIYRADAVFLGNENYTGSNATHYLNITPIIHDSNITNITYNKSNSTIYLNDVINVISYIRNDGNVNEPAINVTLQDNGNVVAWQIVNNLFANETVHETRQINFTWNARNDQIRTISVNALPVTGEVDLSDNSKSFTARVWKVCDVIDCNEFYPRTPQNHYNYGDYFNSSVYIINRWNDQQFYDLKVEMTSTNGLGILSTPILYVNLAPGEATARKWLINVTDMGTQTEILRIYAGNREYAGNKPISIN